MRVLYDITTLGNIHCAAGVTGAGIFRATESLGLALTREPDLDLYVSASPSQFAKAVRYVRETGHFGPHRLAVPGHGPEGFTTVAGLDGGPGDAELETYLASVYSPERIYNPGRFDVYHANWRAETTLPVDVHPGVVVPVFDVIALKHPEWFVAPGEPNPIGDYLTTLLESVRPEHTIVVNTGSVKHDVVERFTHIADEQVHVVPLGVSSSFHPEASETRRAAVRRRYGIPDDRRYLLCVNTLEPRKNMAVAVEAYRRLVRDGADDLCLVLAGAQGWLAGRDPDAGSADGESIVVTGFVDEQDLAALYAGASAFCYPSLDEGFGLPVLEAMRCGVPVVTSDRAPLREVAADAASIVDPLDADALAGAIRDVLDDETRAGELGRRGRERAAAYTWEASAAAMIDVYRAAMETKAARRGGRGVTRPGSRVARVPSGIGSLGELEGAYAGHRCVILGNGPDLERAPLGALGDAYTFAVDAFHRSPERPRWKPTFHLVTADYARSGAAAEINALTGSLFLFEDEARDLLRDHSDVVHYSMDDAGTVAGTRLLGDGDAPPLRGADRALGAAIQIAQFLGFDIALAAPAVDGSWDPGGDVMSEAERREWHRACRQACDRVGTEIVNLTDGTLPNVYPRAEPYELLAAGVLPAFERSAHATLDETEVISRLLAEPTGRTRTMLDVGAHRGTSARHFVGRDWRIHCFEPDAENRSHLVARLGARDDVTIDTRAVGAEPAKGVPFFSSAESSGISGLSAFHDSHEFAGRVDLTTVSEIVDEYDVETIDFLKIDVEGHDLDVLRGVPWERLQPAVIECEYEDAKTLPMGHSTADMVAFLRARGYTVYLSEWHPIIRYGVAHDWRRVVPVPGFDVPSTSWGNLLAFRRDPGYRAIQQAFAAAVRTEPRPDEATAPPAAPAPTPAPVPAAAPAAPTSATASRASYADAADRLRSRSPALYTLLRMVRRLGVRLRRRWFPVAVATALVVVLVGAGLATSGGWRAAIWGATGFGILGAALVIVGVYAYRTGLHQQTTARRLQALERRVVADARATGDRIRAAEQSATRAVADVRTESAGMRAALDTVGREWRTAMDAVTGPDGRLDRLEERVTAADARQEGSEQQSAAAAVRADEAFELARAGVRVVRTELDRLAARLDRVEPPPPVDAEVESPLLSIAIPAFGRPEALEECLASVVREVEAGPFTDVEVWVVDDRSPDPEVPAIAHRYATRYPYIGYRSNEHNIGLERNLLGAVGPTSGSYVWVLGADDVVQPGGVAAVHRDATVGSHDVLLYAKTRTDRTGSRLLPPTLSVLPKLTEGEWRHYDGILDVAAECGIISGFGFISTLVMRRHCLTGAPPDPYFGLSMYPQLGVLLETSARAPVLVRNVPIVYHRTQTAPEKLAEAVGRREEDFMSGGRERDARWFGASLAAMLQRAVDRSGLEATDFCGLPERLFGARDMVGWMRQNRDAALAAEIILPADVVDDAERFFIATSVSAGPDASRHPAD